MIVARDRDELRVVTQPDHAKLAADILTLWAADPLRRHPRRDQLLFAVREHDNGWREADAAPSVEIASGNPHDFVSHPEAARRGIWETGIARFADERPYATLLIVEHALTLHARWRGRHGWEAFHRHLDDTRSQLLERCPEEAVHLDADYLWLDLLDRLSLTACTQSPEPGHRHGFRYSFVGGELALAPFPLAGATTFSLACRYIPQRRYNSDLDLAGELATARWQETDVRVVPLARPGGGRRHGGTA